MSEGHKTFEMMGNYADGVIRAITSSIAATRPNTRACMSSASL